MADIVLYTDSFPYNNSEPFLETEILYLCKVFKTVYIQPLNGSGDNRSIPSNARILPPLGIRKFHKTKMYITGFFNLYLIFREKSFRNKIGEISFLKVLKYIGYAYMIKNKMKHQYLKSELLHYSYWMNYGAASLALHRRKGKIKYFISRIHRYDLYPGSGENALDFFKEFTLKNLDAVYFISEEGKHLYESIFPQFRFKYFISRLGTQNHGKINPVNSRNNLVILSCSMIKPVKRVELILEALIHFSKDYPDVEVNWYHLGGGDGLEKMSSRALGKLNNTLVTCNFTGTMSNKQVFEFYQKNAADVFLNVSETEGVPVSIMEAQSFQIPVIATSVGGTPEIVNDKNGLLLNKNIQSGELARILNDVYLNKNLWLQKRRLSYEDWKKVSNAENNYHFFAKDLLGILPK